MIRSADASRATGGREGDRLIMEIAIPANTAATVYVPAKDAAAVTEGSQPAAQAEGVKFLRTEDGAAVFLVDSGCFHFQSTIPDAIVRRPRVEAQ